MHRVGREPRPGTPGGDPEPGAGSRGLTDPAVLVYGATGYTGRLIVARCRALGLRPIVAGRSEAAVLALAEEHGLPARVFGLTDADAVRAGLAGVAAVLHCAGPFSHTSRPMVDGCLATGAHYLDITGEIAVFEALAARSAEANASGVMLLPGVGFDVVPSDCLAAHLKRRLPSASRLTLAFQASTGLSRGTATTMVENLGRGGAVRRAGSIVSVPAASKTRTVDFGRGPVPVTTIPWGDVATAYHSTGIPEVEVYAAVPGTLRRLMVWSRHLGWLLTSMPVQRLLKRRIRSGPPGPDAEARARGRSTIWGEVVDPAGRRATARLSGPEGYTMTARTAVAALERVQAGDAPPGFRTPSSAYGADFVLRIEGVTREDLE